MEKHTATVDSQRLQDVLNALDTNANALSQKLGYKSHASVYHVLTGLNTMSDNMMERLIRSYPNVNYEYLKKGRLPILLNEDEKIAQMNAWNIVPEDASEYFLFQKFLQIPDKMERMEVQMRFIIDLLKELNAKK